MKYDILILSSLSKNSGCFLRAKYLAHALTQNNVLVKLIIPFSSKPFMLDFLLNFIKYFFIVLFTPYKTGIAIKPYPNTLWPLFIKKFFIKTINIVDIDDIDFGYRQGLFSSLSRFIQKPFPRYCDMATFHNEKLKPFIIKEYSIKANKLYSLKQGVDFTVFNHHTKIKDFKKQFFQTHHIPSHSKLLIYTAHLNIASDLDIILKNIRPILQKNIFFIIAGSGPLYHSFFKMTQNLNLPHIIFTRYLPPEKIIPYILISDFALVYYKDKSVNYFRSSMKIREYLSLRKKIICNDVGELKLFNKFTYQSKTSIHDYMKLMTKLLQNHPQDKREIKGYFYVKKNYNWEHIGADLITKISQFW